MKHIKWFIDLLVVYWQNIEAGKSQKSHAVLVTMFLSEKSQRKNVASWKLKVDCRSRKMSLLFCQFLSFHRNKIVATFFSNVACRQYLLEGLVAISDNSFSVLERKKYVSLKYGSSITELICDINSSSISLPCYIESRSRSITMLCDS